MAGTMGIYQYVSDDGVTYKLKLDASNTLVVGGVAATTQGWYPRGWQPRYLLAFNALHGRRKVTAPDPTHATWVGGTTSIVLEVVGVATSPTFDITARIGEKRTSRG